MASDWISTGAEVFSAVGTVGAFLLGFLLLRREHRREADRAEDDRRTQASQISAWVEAHRRPDGTREVAFHIHNASDMPIYEVELPLPAPAGEEPAEEFIGLVPARPPAAARRPDGNAPTSNPNQSRSSSSTAPDAAGPATNKAPCSAPATGPRRPANPIGTAETTDQIVPRSAAASEMAHTRGREVQETRPGMPLGAHW